VLLGEVLLLGEALLGDMLFGDVVLEASGEVVVLGVAVVLLPAVLDPLLGAGDVRLTSPPAEFVTVPLDPAVLLRMQSVLEVDADGRAAVESALVDAVTPVPLAPFVVFGPLKRCSGFVAVLRVESVAPVVDEALGLIVVDVEYPVVPVLDDIAPVRIGGQGVPFALVRCCAPAVAASVAPSTSATPAARHRASCGCAILM
jgi:hypothetical protein